MDGDVGIALWSDRAAIAGLNNPQLWTADKVSNHANLSKGSGELVSLWNTKHPDDPVVEK